MADLIAEHKDAVRILDSDEQVLSFVAASPEPSVSSTSVLSMIGSKSCISTASFLLKQGTCPTDQLLYYKRIARSRPQPMPPVVASSGNND